jgi:NAD(P)-dependent dehydrogenase (short-subunit alcohol dehydrogenase family)
MKRVLVTGANKGIGLAIVKAILEQGDDTFVYLGSRNPERGATARDSIVADNASWGERVEVLAIDVSDDESVRAAAAKVAEAGERPLYGVVNNAGIGFGGSDLAGVLAVNTQGVRRVSEAFLPLVQDEGGRIVNVTSASGPNFVNTCEQERQAWFINPEVSREDFDAFLDDCLKAESSEAFQTMGLGSGEPYGLSKAAANLYTLQLARENPKLHVNACTPGFIETDLTRPYAEGQGKTPADMGMKPPAEGARSPLHLLFGELEGNGRYYGSDAVRSPMDRYRAPGDPPFEGD